MLLYSPYFIFLTIFVSHVFFHKKSIAFHLLLLLYVPYICFFGDIKGTFISHCIILYANYVMPHDVEAGFFLVAW
jgi:hypothetical protein